MIRINEELPNKFGYSAAVSADRAPDLGCAILPTYCLRVLTKTVVFGIQSASVKVFARFREVRNAIPGAVGAFLRQ